MIPPTDHLLLLALAVVVAAVVVGVAEMVEVVEVVEVVEAVEVVGVVIQIRLQQASWTSRMWWTWRGCNGLAP